MTIRIRASRTCGSLSGAALLLASASASAATLTVSNGGAPCPGASFTTIQAAVDAAAPHDTVLVCPGTYAEQITVAAGKDGLVLRASEAHAAILTAPPVMSDPGDLVRINAAKDVTVEGFKIVGPLPDALFCSPFPRAGIRVDGGGSANIRFNHIREIRSASTDLRGCQSGVGILVGSFAEGEVGTASIVRNTIEEYQKAGVLVGGAGSVATVAANRVKGDGPNALIAQNGIEMRNGGGGVVVGNEVSGQVYSPSPLAAALLFYLPGRVSVIANRVSDADYGIFAIDAVNAEITSNIVSACAANGIDLDELTTGTTGTHVAANVSFQNAQDGIRVSGRSSGNTLRRNFVVGNGDVDVRDDSSGKRTAGTANAWRSNQCKTDNHGGLLCEGEGHHDAEE